jgi:hypothetical protein
MTDLAKTPQLADLALNEIGTRVGELDGQQFYSVNLVVARLPDGRLVLRGPLEAWQATLEGRLIASEARAQFLEEQLVELRDLVVAAPATPVEPPAPASVEPCPHCGREFSDRRGRYKHVAHCKGSMPVEPPHVAPAPPALAPCPHCGRGFSHVLGRQRHIDSCARRQAPEPPAEPEPAASPFPEPPAPAVPRRVRFGEQPIAPRWEPAPTPRASDPIERHQCPSCMRSFDSIPAYNRHTCKPAAPAPLSPYADLLPPPPPLPIIPDDPAAAAEELARLSAGRWPRPCPECWQAGLVELLKGPAGMAAHRKAAHSVVPMLARPAIAWAPGGWRCADCGSAAFARDLHDPSICVRCAAERKHAAATA